MEQDVNQSEREKQPLVIAPVPNAAEYTASVEIWDALTTEINHVVSRIDAGEELTPEDVIQVRELKKQVESYLTMFNKAMRDAQSTYKNLLAKQLETLGYEKIDNYIQIQRQKQTMEQNTRLANKQAMLQQIVSNALNATTLLKTTVLAGELLPAFVSRFPKVNSSAKDKEITNWGPYEAIIQTTVNMLEVFFKDPIFTGAVTLPVTSATMQQLLKYVRDGNLEHLSVMRDIFAKDGEYLIVQKLKTEITTKDMALTKITKVMSEGISTDDKLREIARIIRIAETL